MLLTPCTFFSFCPACTSAPTPLSPDCGPGKLLFFLQVSTSLGTFSYAIGELGTPFWYLHTGYLSTVKITLTMIPHHYLFLYQLDLSAVLEGAHCEVAWTFTSPYPQNI